jgi:glycosyltransferase involved in cell wall biosynthesis
LVERFVFRHVDLTAGANQDNLNYALANGASPARSTLFRYGNLIDRRHFIEPCLREHKSERLEELGLEPGRYMITVARLEVVNALKHPDHVVRVLAKLRAKGLDVKTVLVGEGRLRASLEELARELGVSDHLIIAGSRNQAWLADIYAHAALMISTHAGRALSEAALAGVPVVAYDVDWQRELIETDATGILVPHGDLEGLAEGAERLLEDRDNAARMGSALRNRAQEMLEPAMLNEHERWEYSKLLAPGPDPAA